MADRARIRDVRGKVFDPAEPPRRIVSLVPSITETLFDFGCADRLIARTDYCIHPEAAASVPSIGGTKNPDLDAIRSLRPDLICTNQEENRKADVEALEAAGLRVFVTFPRSVLQAIHDLESLADLLSVAPSAREQVAAIRKTWRNMRSYIRPAVSVFVPVWRDPWMTFNNATFAHDLLTLLGLYNVFADRERRYPRVTLEEVDAQRPQLVLLPDEPYRFALSDAHEIARRLELPVERVRLIDGSLLFWHGTRLQRALRELPAAVAL